MFEAHAGRSRRGWLGLGFVVAAIALGIAWLGDPVPRALVAAGGGNPLADPFAADHTEGPYAESPLAVSLAMEEGLSEVDRDGVLSFADALAREVGFWALSTTGARDIEAAEAALWDQGRIDDLAVKWALAMQARELHSREKQGRLAPGIPEHGPRYAQPEEIAMLLAHVGWRLDLDLALIRSPEHWYVELRQPGGAGRRGVEPTCFWRVDNLGKQAPSDEPSVGRRLTFPPDHYSSGAGGIRNPKVLPPGTYEAISASELTGALLAKLGERYDLDPAALAAKFDQAPTEALGQALFRARVAAGIAAWERADLDQVRAEAAALQALRAAHGELLGEAPDEKVLESAVLFADHDDKPGYERLHEVIRFYEPDGPVLYPVNAVHEAAMWMDLRYGRPTEEDWNRRIIPLMNRHKSEPERMAELCALGRKVLAGTSATVEERIPDCQR